MPKSADKPGARRLPAGHELPAPTGEFEHGTCGATAGRRPCAPGSRSTPSKSKRGVRVYVDVAGSTYEIPVQTGGMPLPLARRWRQAVPYRVAANHEPQGPARHHDGAAVGDRSTGAGKRLRHMLSRLKRKVIR